MYSPCNNNGPYMGFFMSSALKIKLLTLLKCYYWSYLKGNLKVVRDRINRMITQQNNVPSQGNFPRMENIAAFKPVSTSPTRSTCGVPERSSYCQSPSSQAELMTCYQAFCVQECPYRSSTPPYAPLLLSAHRYVTFIMLFRRDHLLLIHAQ